jgi:hypothetical protein
VRKGGLTPERFAELAPALIADPESYRRYSDLVAKGGRLPPGPPDPSYVAEVSRESARDPEAYAARILDPVRLGTLYDEEVRRQSAVLSGQANPALPFRESLERRLAQTGEEDDEATAARFYVLAEQEHVIFVSEKKREPNGVEQEQIIDQAMLKLAVEKDIDPVLSGMNPIDRTLLGDIPPDHLETVRRSLEARGAPATPSNIRKLYDAARAAGRLR